MSSPKGKEGAGSLTLAQRRGTQQAHKQVWFSVYAEAGTGSVAGRGL